MVNEALSHILKVCMVADGFTGLRQLKSPESLWRELLVVDVNQLLFVGSFVGKPGNQHH